MKMKNNKIIFILLLLVLIVSSCTSETKIVEQITPTLISDIKTPTNVPTNTLSPTPELGALIQVEKSCMNLESLPTDLKLTGVWIRQRRNPYLENLDEGTKYRIPLDGGGILSAYHRDLSVSPNGKWLAYLDAIIDTSNPRKIARTEGYSLKVIHSSGHSLSMGYWPISSQGIQGWVDNQNLLLKLNGQDIVLNPFSGRWYEIENPEWLEKMNLNDSWLRDDKKYSPSLDQVIVYLDTRSELRDVVSGEIIFGDPPNYHDFTQSLWSPDGTMLALSSTAGKILHILREDKEILNIDISLSGLISKQYSESIHISNMEWSLNNQKLIIETFYDTFMLDINDKKIYDVCFFDEKLEKTWLTKSFFYSEDGKYIVTSLYVKDESYSFETFDVLVDLTNMRAYKLDTPKYKQRIGWLSSP